jgi:hypothetical protein
MFVTLEMLQCHVQLRINGRETRRFTYETVGRMELLAISLLKATGYVMHHQFKIQQL